MQLPLNALFKTTTNGLIIISPRQTKVCAAFKELGKAQKEAVLTVQPNKLEARAETLKRKRTMIKFYSLPDRSCTAI